MAVALLLVAALVVPGAASVSATPAASVSIVTPSGDLGVGMEFTVPVEVAGATDLWAGELHIKFDQTRLQVVDADITTDITIEITGGSLFDGRPPDSYFVAQNRADNAAGTIDFAFTLLGSSTPPLDPDGVLVSITFEAIAEGVADISFDNSWLPDPSLFPAVRLLALTGDPQLPFEDMTLTLYPGQVQIVHFEAPVAQFTASPLSGYAPLAVQFTDESTGGIVTWAWDFDNDGTVDSNEQNPSHIYELAGIYSVRLEVTNPLNTISVTATDYITAQQAVEVVAGIAFLALDQTAVIPILVRQWTEATDPTGMAAYELQIAFDNTVIRVDSVDGAYPFANPPFPAVNILESSVLVSSLHLEASGPIGEFEIAYLNVTGIGSPGATTVLDVIVTKLGAVSGAAIVGAGIDGQVTMLKPDFTGTPLAGAAPLSVGFSDTSNGTPSAWAWNFGDGSTSDVQHPTHTYNSGGTFTVALTTTWDGTSMTETKAGYINAVKAGFSATPTGGTSPLTAQFSDASQGPVTAWAWDFDNDGTVDSTAQNPSHEYAEEGSYTVKQTVSNAALGISDDEVKVNYINVVNIVAETGLEQYQDDDGVIVLNADIERLKHPVTLETVEMTAGLGAFEAQVNFDPNGIDLLNVRPVAPFDGALWSKNLNFPDKGLFASLQLGEQPSLPSTAGRLVVRLVGSATAPYQLTLSFGKIADTEGKAAPEEAPVSVTFLRGDANGDGAVDIIDALYIAQFTVRLRLLPTLRAVNAASVSYDGAAGDKIDIVDALFVAQYRVQLKDEFYRPKTT